MKIGHIIREPRLAGAEILVSRLCDQHLRVGVVPCIISTHPINANARLMVQQVRDKGIEFVVPDRPLGRLARVAFLRKALKSAKPDVAFAHTVLPSLFTRIAAIGLNVPIISVLHSGVEDYWGNIELSERIAPRPTAIVGAVEQNLAWYRARFGERTPLRVVPNGVDVAQFQQPLNRRPQIRTTLFGEIGGSIVFAQIGRLSPEKRQGMSIAAFEKLPQSRQKQCLLVFAGLPEDPAETARVKAATERNAAIRFLGPLNNVADLYAAADVILAPSHHEAHPLAVIEGLCSQGALIVSAIPAHQFARDYAGVTLVRDVDEMAAAMAAIEPRRYERPVATFDIARTARSYEAIASEFSSSH